MENGIFVAPNRRGEPRTLCPGLSSSIIISEALGLLGPQDLPAPGENTGKPPQENEPGGRGGEKVGDRFGQKYSKDLISGKNVRQNIDERD